MTVKYRQIKLYFIPRNSICFYTILIFTPLCFFITAIFFQPQRLSKILSKERNIEPPSRIIHYIFPADNQIECHKTVPNDIVPIINNEAIPEHSLFFIETSCKGGLDSRQACSVESAARANPDRQINILFAGPVSKLFRDSTTLYVLKSFPNARIFRLHVADYTKGTPVESLIANNTVNESPYCVSHMSDILRITTLYKYGGTYLDLDVLTVRSYDTLPRNWLAKEKDNNISAGVMAFENKNVGKLFTKEALRDLNTNYLPDEWAHNGPLMVSRVIKKICKIKEKDEINTTRCHGIEIYSSKQFYPIHWSKWKTYFEPPQKELNLTGIYAHHIYGKMTHEAKVTSDCLYAVLAKRFCPSIYALFSDDFGS